MSTEAVTIHESPILGETEGKRKQQAVQNEMANFIHASFFVREEEFMVPRTYILFSFLHLCTPSVVISLTLHLIFRQQFAHFSRRVDCDLRRNIASCPVVVGKT